MVGFAVWPRPAPPVSYRRFTSPALPDGVRYTLLYPSTLDDASFHTFPATTFGRHFQQFMVSKKQSRAPIVSLWHQWFKPEVEFIFVSADSVTKPLKTSRIERQGLRNSGEIAHWVYVDDPRAQVLFTFGHIEENGTALYKQNDPVVAGSFRVLLPGEAVPNP